MMDYIEKQKLNNKAILFIFFLAAIGAMAGITISTAEMAVDGVNEYIVYLIPVLITGWLILIYFILFRSELETSLNQSGFSYRYFPFIIKTRLSDFREITSWKIADIKQLSFMAQKGYKKSPLRKKMSIILDGDKYLELNLNNGYNLMFSTTNPFALSSALRKYISDKEFDKIING